MKVIILAAGQGTRMHSARPKVLHEIAGLPLVGWMLRAAAQLEPDELRVVIGYQAELVAAALPAGTLTTLQPEQTGTGHAVALALAEMEVPPDDVVVVLPGDHPGLTGTRLVELAAVHRTEGAAATLLTTVLDDPTGYGRVLRDGSDRVVGVVEHRDATESERSIREVATSVYAFRPSALGPALAQVGSDNTQGEHYLPDVVSILAASGERLAAVIAPADEAGGINSFDQLAEVAARMRARINRSWMQEGVWMLDPGRVYVDSAAVLAPGVRIYPGVHIEGASVVGPDAEVGPDVHLRDSRVGEGARIRYAVLEGAEVGPGADVGPYARLRPGTVLGAGSKAGTYVELKNTTVGAGSKVPHLAYMGDAEIGEAANIGAGTITCNWDGESKNATRIGNRAFIGSDTMLVAPVEIGDDAWTGAGSTITRDVPAGALAVERSEQKTVLDYAAKRKRRKPGKGDA